MKFSYQSDNDHRNKKEKQPSLQGSYRFHNLMRTSSKKEVTRLVFYRIENITKEVKVMKKLILVLTFQGNK
ncbi:hypothetical protein AAG747_20415 [Rapidithrix thailandica]|uniref:Uncharacterized protein n=1 Tax=Rapidithrix thailandica TaxID=413964 RepID=A0AAW9SEV1_9BACT